MTTFLRQAVDEALTALGSDPDGDLSLCYRRRVWAALGPKDMDQPFGIGHVRRIRLARLTVENCLPLWRAELPDNRLIEQTLNAAEQFQEGNLSTKEAWEQWHQAWEAADEMECSGAALILQNQHIGCLGYAAAHVIYVAIEDETLEVEEEGVVQIDIMVEPEEHDVAFFVASIYAKGSVWDKDSDPIKRRAFWE